MDIHEKCKTHSQVLVYVVHTVEIIVFPRLSPNKIVKAFVPVSIS